VHARARAPEQVEHVRVRRVHAELDALADAEGRGERAQGVDAGKVGVVACAADEDETGVGVLELLEEQGESAELGWMVLLGSEGNV
jgi:hypothetical protein